MRLFKCQSCGNLLYFENRQCERCGHHLGYLPDRNVISALEPASGDWTGPWRALGDGEALHKFCANARYDVCNWLIPADSPETLCRACRHNRTIPDTARAENLRHWGRLELAKHRLIYSLLRLGLPLVNRGDDPQNGLAFDFLAESPAPQSDPVITGHDHGLITLALKEADDATREQIKDDMGEAYRTLLGHFRHEVGHYYWDRLIRDAGRLEMFRRTFGDERQDYDAALRRHYAEGPPADWQEHFVSAYATTHPWEDFAETWAHYLHIVDTLETAAAFGLEVHPQLDRSGSLHAEIDFNPYGAPDMDTLIGAWLPLTFAVNNLNRSMGHQDAYPFVLAPAVIAKLGFVHGLMPKGRAG